MTKTKLFSVGKRDFVIETFRAGGSGGQNQNKRDTGVRIKHPDSGAVVESRTHRTQGENKKEAFRRLIETEKFKLWLKRRCAESLLSSQERERRAQLIEDEVRRLMAPEYLLTEYLGEDGQWRSDPTP